MPPMTNFRRRAAGHVNRPGNQLPFALTLVQAPRAEAIPPRREPIEPCCAVYVRLSFSVLKWRKRGTIVEQHLAARDRLIRFVDDRDVQRRSSIHPDGAPVDERFLA